MKFIKVNLNVLLFSLAYYPWVIAWMFSSTLLKDYLHPYVIINYWQYVGVVFLLVKFLLKHKINILSLLTTLFFIAVAFVVSYGNDNASFVFYSIFLIFSGADQNLEKIIKYTMILQIVCLLITVFSAVSGIVDNEVVTSTAGNMVRMRHNLGYTFTTFTPNYFLSIVLEYIFIKKLDLSIIELLIIALLNIIIYKLTLTRLTMILVFFILIYLLGIKKIGYERFLSKLSTVSFILLSAISYFISVVYTPQNRILNVLNSVLSERIQLSQVGLQTWGVNLFGTSVNWNSESINYNYIDSSYINILVCYGLVIFVIVIVGFTLVNLRAKQVQNFPLLFVLLMWAIRATIDPQLFLIWFNPFIFYIGKSLLSYKAEEFI